MVKETLLSVIDWKLDRIEMMTKQQLMLVELLCEINESEYLNEAVKNCVADEFKSPKVGEFILENASEVKSNIENEFEIERLTLSFSQEFASYKKEYLLLVDVKYTEEEPDFFYVRLICRTEDENKKKEKYVYNWDKEILVQADKMKQYKEKSGFMNRMTISYI